MYSMVLEVSVLSSLICSKYNFMVNNKDCGNNVDLIKIDL